MKISTPRPFGRVPLSLLSALFLTVWTALAETKETASSALPSDEVVTPAAGHSLHGEVFNEGPRQRAYLMEGMAKLSFPVTTRNPQAQAFFNQAVAQFHGYWFFEAERSFRQAAALDPDLAMAYWGMSMANFKNDKRAKGFIAQAVKRKSHASERERKWIDSLAAFFEDEKREKKTRMTTLVHALEAIIFEYPDDMEAKAFLAYHLVWERAGLPMPTSRRSVDALIGEIMAKNPQHPAHHYRIHLWDAEDAAVRALDSAGWCGQSEPGIAHMWHMPGHIYSKTKRYADAVWQQEASARVDHAQMIKNRLMPDEIHNYAHNNEWLVRSLAHVGRVHESVDLARNMMELPRLVRRPVGMAPGNESTPAPSAAKADGAKGGESYGGEHSEGGNEPIGISYGHGRRRIFDVLARYEQWDELIRLVDSGVIDAGFSPEEAILFHRAIGVAEYSRGRKENGERHLTSLEEILQQAKASPPAEKKADATAKPAEKDLAKPAAEAAMATKAGRPKNTSMVVKAAETAIAELKGYSELAAGNADCAFEEFAKASDMPKDRLARLQLSAGKTTLAEETAQAALKASPLHVQVLANTIDILNRAGKKDLASDHFRQLREVSAQVEMEFPVFQRLAAFAAELRFPADWRLPAVAAKDVGPRPKLDELGPFRWRPSPAPAWTLTGFSGKSISLADYKGRPVIAIFYLGQGCPHCLAQLNAFAPMARKFEAAGISLVAVSTDSIEGLKGSLTTAESGPAFPFPIVSDSSLQTFKAYRAFDDFEDIPLHGTFVIDGNGLVRWQDISHEPFMRIDFLLEEAQRLLRISEARLLEP